MKQIRTENIIIDLLDNSTKHRLISNKKLLTLFSETLEQIELNWESIFGSAKLNKDLKLHTTICLCGVAKIKTLNNVYRNKNRITDVLSFQLQPSLTNKTNQRSIFKINDIELGDIYICKEVAKRQAKHFQISWQAEIIHLFIHGFLHLLGYDHELSQQEQKKMERIESRIIKGLLKDE